MSDGTFKVATLNILHNQERWEERLPLIVDELHRINADVICLQEVWLPLEQAHLIARGLAERSGRVYTVHQRPKWGGAGEEGLAILSRLPVVAHDGLDLPRENRVAQCVELDMGGRPVYIANVHLHHLPFDDESIRLPQVNALLDWMFAHSPGGWLLAGDFNAPPDRATIARVAQHLHSAYADHNGREAPITFPSPAFAVRYPSLHLTIDYIFYDPAAFAVHQALRFALLPHPQDPQLSASDHMGICAAFSLR